MEFIPHKGILVPVSATKPVLDGPEMETIRILKHNNSRAPEGTPEPIRTAFERMAAALIEAERFKLLLPQLQEPWLQIEATSTLRLLGPAMEGYRRAEMHLLKPNHEGLCPFKDAYHRLYNSEKTLTDFVALGVVRLFGNYPPVDAAKLLDTMRKRIAAITEMKEAPPRRHGNCWTIQGYDIRLTPRSAELLGFALEVNGTPVQEVLSEIEQDRITPYSSRLSSELLTDLEGQNAPFMIDISASGGILKATIIQKLQKP